MSIRPLTEEEVNQFNRDGILLVRGLFTKEEIELLYNTAKGDKILQEKSYERRDGEGGISKLTLWNHPPDNLYGMFARCNRLVEATEKLLGDEVYHYHSKLMLKEGTRYDSEYLSFVGGRWDWHQGCLFPTMLSAMIAIDRATKENGCLQVLRGSHHMGRVNHVLTREQAGADMERVNEALKRFELVYCEMEPGDVFFMHSNKSPNPRWTLIIAYNTKGNDPYKDSHHPRYTPLHKAILETGVKGFLTGNTESFLDPEMDHSATANAETK